MYEISRIKKPTKEKVKQLYGQLGVDIFEGKKDITLRDNPLPKIFQKLNSIRLFIFGGIEDYQYDDNLNDVIMKYISIKNKFKDTEIYEKFGEKGLEKIQQFRSLGYLEELL